jgi:hypothetical protein
MLTDDKEDRDAEIEEAIIRLPSLIINGAHRKPQTDHSRYQALLQERHLNNSTSTFNLRKGGSLGDIPQK